MTAIRNHKGFTLIELLIAMAISVIVMAGAVFTFSKQNQVFKDEKAKTDVRALGRLAMAELTRQIRQAGYGMPPDMGVKASNYSATSLTYYFNRDDVSTTIVADASSGTSQVTVSSGMGASFASGDRVAIFDAKSTTIWEGLAKTVTAVSTDTLTLNGNLTNSYTVSRGIVISDYHEVTYAYNAGTDCITRSVDGATPTNVVCSVTSFSFTYHNGAGNTPADETEIEHIGINFTMDDSDTVTKNTDIDFHTKVSLRNL